MMFDLQPLCTSTDHARWNIRHLTAGIYAMFLFGIMTGCGPGDASSRVSSEDTSAPQPARDSQSVAEGERKDMRPAQEAPPAGQQGWGHVRGRFVFDGSPPEQKELQVTTDVAYCSAHHPLDESLIVNPQNAGLVNVIVSLYLARDEAPPRTHPDYEQSADAKITLDNLKCRFDPHVVTLRTTQTLVVMNSDAVGHNTKIDTLNNPPINVTLPAGGILEHQFSQPERRPAGVSCSIHPWMSAWVLVSGHPYVVVSDADGRFEINNLPAGEHSFQAWHETGLYIPEVTRDGAKQAWSRGRFTVRIPPEETVDLGDILVSADLFSGR
jgi:hypothetical protein